MTKEKTRGPGMGDWRVSKIDYLKGNLGTEGQGHFPITDPLPGTKKQHNFLIWPELSEPDW